jgi:hypothetical protein
MKQKFTIEINFDGIVKQTSYITNNEKEINYLSYFFKSYDKNLSILYNCPNVIENHKKREGKCKNFVQVLNKMTKLHNEFVGKENLDYLDEDEQDVFTLHIILNEHLDFVDDILEGELYNIDDDYYGDIVGLNIELIEL